MTAISSKYKQKVIIDTHWLLFGSLQIVKAHSQNKNNKDLPNFAHKKKLGECVMMIIIMILIIMILTLHYCYYHYR